MAEQIWYEDGKVRVENGSAVVLGAGTFWLSHVRSGDLFAVTGGGPAKELYQVESVDDNSQITLAIPYQGATANDAEYAIIRNFTGAWSRNADIAYQVESTIRQIKSALQNNLKGDKGETGKDGKTILGNVGAPSPTEGTDGDWYLNITTWDMYRKESGTWILRGALQGPKGSAGKDGVQWYYDETPAPGIGNLNDINFNGTTGDVHRRTATGWVLVGNFRGPEGKQGKQGETGLRGEAARWHSGSGGPSTTIGGDGDMYLNKTNGDTYKKASGSWTLDGNIRGPVGLQGVPGALGLTFKGTWASEAQYDIRDAVRYLGNVWIAKAVNKNVAPPAASSVGSNDAWDLFVEKGTDGLGSGDMLKSVYDPDDEGKVLTAKNADHALAADTASQAVSAASVPWSGVEDVPEAGADTSGIVALATGEETLAGELGNKAATPLGVKAAIEAATEAIVFPDPVEIVNTLDSDRTDAALSAAQGKALKTVDTAIVEALNEKAEIEHQHKIENVDGLKDALQNVVVTEATQTAKGIIRIATDQEATDGELETVAVTPKQLKDNAGGDITQLASNLAIGNWILRSATGVNSNLVSAAWSPKLKMFLAVGSLTAGAYNTSIDGVNWSNRTGIGNGSWAQVIWCPELEFFITVGASLKRVQITADGVNWTGNTNLPFDGTWSSICWSPELHLFVAVIQSQAFCATSPDGINWTQRAMPSAARWNSVCWSPELGVFVAIGYQSSVVATSPDGVVWMQRSLPSVAEWMAVAWSPKLRLFVAVSYNNNICATSPDGINWTQRTMPDTANWSAICWSPELEVFVALAQGASVCATSNDGINWTRRAMPATAGWVTLAWSPYLGLFVALSYGTTSIAATSLVVG